MEKIVRIECKGAAELDLDFLLAFQGDLKILTEENFKKLRDEIIRDGFSEPISVWNQVTRGENSSLSCYYVLNGHQRLTTLRRMREDGWVVPKIPVSLIEAADERAAKRKVLALTSQYGTMTEDGLTEFIKAAELDFGDVSKSFIFPEVDFEDIQTRFNLPPVGADPNFGPGDAEEQGKLDEKSPIECPECGHLFKA